MVSIMLELKRCMLFSVYFNWQRRVALMTVLLGGLLALTPLAALATGTVTLAWDPSSSTNTIASYNLYHGGASGTYADVVSAGIFVDGEVD